MHQVGLLAFKLLEILLSLSFVSPEMYSGAIDAHSPASNFHMDSGYQTLVIRFCEKCFALEPSSQSSLFILKRCRYRHFQNLER